LSITEKGARGAPFSISSDWRGRLSGLRHISIQETTMEKKPIELSKAARSAG